MLNPKEKYYFDVKIKNKISENILTTSRIFTEEKHNRSDECPVICSYLDTLVFKGFVITASQLLQYKPIHFGTCIRSHVYVRSFNISR